MPRSSLSLKELQLRYSDPHSTVSPQVLRKLKRDPRAGARNLLRTLTKRSENQRREKMRVDSMLHFERLLWKAGIRHIAGVDEVGMGPLAGPVVAAAVIFPPDTEIDAVDDSKALDEATRCRLDTRIREKAAAVAVGVVDVEEIDRVNIYHAGLHAMRLALANLSIAPQHVLVDSRTIPGIVQPQNSFNKGDGINFSIAAASIVAKVYRDRLMAELDAVYPGYGFARNKGYGTGAHQDAIRKLGPSPIHRRSFDYIREIRGQYCDLYYALKSRGVKLVSYRELSAWETEIRACAGSLSETESRKLHLLKNRLWRRIES